MPMQAQQFDVESVARDLVRVREIDGSFFVNLPIIYPDGSFVTVKVDKTAGGIRVSDAGFAYREADDLNAGRSFTRTANRVAEETGVTVANKAIFVDADIGSLERAICDVAETSWRVASAISARVFEEEDVELSEELTSRLKKVFGKQNVHEGERIVGQSTTEWLVSAVVSIDAHKAVFQAVSDHPNSIYRTSTAFRDLSQTESGLRLVAFVRSKAGIGPKLSLLVPGKIIEESQADEFFRRAAA